MRNNVNSNGFYSLKRFNKQKITILFPLIILLVVTIGCMSSCKDNTVQPKFNETRNPVILSMTVFPTFVKPNDSLIVVCDAMDPDADTLVYDWYSVSGNIVRIKGALPGSPDLYNTHQNSQIFYAPESIHVSAPQDTFWIECAARDGKGGQVSQHIYFIVKQNIGSDMMKTIK